MALRLIQELVDAAAVESGKFRLEPIDHNIRPTVDRAVEESRAQHAGLTIDVDAPNDLPAIHADPDRIWQVVSNLISNAARFSPKDGRIQVIIRADDAFVFVTVHDEGPGVLDSDRDRLFEKFSRGSRTGGTGAGLGLYICKTLIDAQGGRMWLEPTSDGKGAAFTFSIPRASSP